MWIRRLYSRKEHPHCQAVSWKGLMLPTLSLMEIFTASFFIPREMSLFSCPLWYAAFWLQTKASLRDKNRVACMLSITYACLIWFTQFESTFGNLRPLSHLNNIFKPNYSALVLKVWRIYIIFLVSYLEKWRVKSVATQQLCVIVWTKPILLCLLQA